MRTRHTTPLQLTPLHEKGKTIEGTSCRIAGYIPPAAPGRKSKAQLMGAAAAAAADKN